MHSFYLDAIRNFEGFTPQAQWDYAQFSNGYGTKARFAGEVIDRVEADRRFRDEVASARSIVDKAVPDVDEGTKAALTSLTYNAGTAWIDSGLGDAVRRGDLDSAREIFQKYNKAGGEVLPGLVNRRSQEVQWIGTGDVVGTSSTLAQNETAAPGDAALPPVIVQRPNAVADVTEFLRAQADKSAKPADAVEQRQTASPAAMFERVAAAGALGSVTSEALVAMIEADRLGSSGVSDFMRLAQLGRGSDLAGNKSDDSNDKARRV